MASNQPAYQARADQSNHTPMPHWRPPMGAGMKMKQAKNRMGWGRRNQVHALDDQGGMGH